MSVGLERRRELHGYEWCYYGPASAATVMRELARNSEIDEPTLRAAEHTFSEHDLNVALAELIVRYPE
jgi:hypothetical protein